MALVLDGSAGISGVDGTASNPAIEGTDSNTGIFYPAADTVAIGTGGTEALRIDSARNMGLGATPSAWASGWRALTIGSLANINSTDGWLQLLANAYYDGANYKYIASASTRATRYLQNGGVHSWEYSAAGTAGNNITFTQAMTLDASGNLVLGTTSSLSSSAGRTDLTINAASTSALISLGVGAIRRGYIYQDTSELTIANEVAGTMRFLNNGSERARITSGGALWVGNTTRQSTDNHTFIQSVTAGDWTANFQCNTATAANNLGILINYSGSAPNGTASHFLRAIDSSSTRCEIRSNGGIANFSANNVNLSDRREKTNFAPAKNYLDVICAIPVQTFNYIDQSDDDPGLTLGVVAQDVQAVAPEMVMESNWGTEEEPKMRLSIYQTDLQYALMKSIQELKAIVDAQAAEIAALKGNA